MPSTLHTAYFKQDRQRVARGPWCEAACSRQSQPFGWRRVLPPGRLLAGGVRPLRPRCCFSCFWNIPIPLSSSPQSSQHPPQEQIPSQDATLFARPQKQTLSCPSLIRKWQQLVPVQAPRAQSSRCSLQALPPRRPGALEVTHAGGDRLLPNSH